jgi:hypothetical protein
VVEGYAAQPTIQKCPLALRSKSHLFLVVGLDFRGMPSEDMVPTQLGTRKTGSISTDSVPEELQQRSCEQPPSLEGVHHRRCRWLSDLLNWCGHDLVYEEVPVPEF